MIHFRILAAAVFIFLHQQRWVFAAPTNAADGHKTSSTHPTQSSTSSLPSQSSGDFASDDPNDSFLSQFQGETPEAIRGNLGATVIGPQNVPLDRQNPDMLAPPSTDAGSVSNAKWPFSLSHNRIQQGGWARQQNSETMPIATEMAGVNMRLAPGAIRELHWHAAAEWAFVLSGEVRITAVTPDGKHYEADTEAGDVWYFPTGIPHSIQATNATVNGAEFLLVFDSGDFSEDDTFLLTDWLAHVPKEVLAKNFGVDISTFDHIPKDQLYIFPGAPPMDKIMLSPQEQPPNPFSFAWSKSESTPLAGGSVKVLDSTNFPVSKTIGAANVIVQPGSLRELHWHPTQAEWTYFISGNARVTIFAADGNARTFNYQAGDVGYVPPSNGHYVENIGNDTLHYLEIFKTDKVQDISLTQWLALTPPELVKAHLNLDDETIAKFNKTKQTVV